MKSNLVGEIHSLYTNAKDFNLFFQAFHDFLNKNIHRLNSFFAKDVINGMYDDYQRNFQQITHQKMTVPEKKRTGLVYTPKSICEVINKRVLNYANIEENCLQVLDPACGNGYFLIDIIFQLCFSQKHDIDIIRLLKEGIYGADINLNSIRFIRSFLKVLVLCVYTEKLQKSLESKRAQIEIVNKIRKICECIDKNIVCGDFLQDDGFDKRKFDVVIGNPPYVRVHKLNKDMNRELRNNYFTPYRDFDIYICFFERGLHLLKTGGILGYVTPEKYLQKLYAKNLRRFMLANSFLLEIINISRCHNVFDADIYPLITILRRNSLKNSHELKMTNLRNRLIKLEKNSMPLLYIDIGANFNDQKSKLETIYSLLENAKNNTVFSKGSASASYYSYNTIVNFLENPNYIFILNNNANFKQLNDHLLKFITLGKILANNSILCGTPRAKDYKKVKNGLAENENSTYDQSDEILRYIVSRNVFPYNIIWGLNIRSIGNEYRFPVFDLKSGLFSKNLRKRFHNSQKILIRANAKRIIASLDAENSVFNGIYSISLDFNKSIENRKIELNEKHLLAILNSDLINFYVLVKFQSYMVNSEYLSINKAILSNIPLPIFINQKTTSKNSSLNQDVLQKIVDFSNQLMKVSKDISLYVNPDDPVKMRFILNFLRDPHVLYAYLSYLETQTDGKSVIIQKELEDKLIKYAEMNKKLNTAIYRLYNIPKRLQDDIEVFFAKKGAHSWASLRMYDKE